MHFRVAVKPVSLSILLRFHPQLLHLYWQYQHSSGQAVHQIRDLIQWKTKTGEKSTCSLDTSTLSSSSPHSSIIARHKGGISQVCRNLVLSEKLPAQRPSAPQQECKGRRVERGWARSTLPDCRLMLAWGRAEPTAKAQFWRKEIFPVDPLEVAGLEKWHNGIS